MEGFRRKFKSISLLGELRMVSFPGGSPPDFPVARIARAFASPMAGRMANGFVCRSVIGDTVRTLYVYIS